MLTFAPLTCFQVKVFIICYEDTLLFMINNLDKDRKNQTGFCSVFHLLLADFKDLFWEKQSLFIMTCWLKQLTSQESSESVSFLLNIFLWDFWRNCQILGHFLRSSKKFQTLRI